MTSEKRIFGKPNKTGHGFLTMMVLVQWTDREGKTPLIVACMFSELFNMYLCENDRYIIFFKIVLSHNHPF